MINEAESEFQKFEIVFVFIVSVEDSLSDYPSCYLGSSRTDVEDNENDNPKDRTVGTRLQFSIFDSGHALQSDTT